MLISTLELETFMGREFTASEEAQAESLISVVSAAIESFVGFEFEYIEDDYVVMQADGHGIIEFNAKKVVDVSEVLNTEGEVILGWIWDGMNALHNLFPQQTVGITYSHGYETIPRDIKGIALGMASRVMYNPSGLRQETVGAISVTYPGIGGEAGTINMSNLERSILNDKYGRPMTSMRLGVSRRRDNSLPVLTVYNQVD